MYGHTQTGRCVYMGTHRQADVYVWAHTDSERTLFGRIEELLQLIPLVFAYLLQVRVPFLVLGFRFKGLDWVYAYLLKYVYLSCAASTRCPAQILPRSIAHTPTLSRRRTPKRAEHACSV
jgi:hypothetical protein